MKIDVTRPEILRIAYRQEQGDKGYGSCLWAFFDFDLEEYALSIQSDCGNAGHAWYKAKSETFLHLMARISKEYLLNKLFEEDCVDVPATMERVRDELGLYEDEDEDEELDRERAEQDLEELESTLNMCNHIAEAQHALDEWAQEHEEYELWCDAWENAVGDYSSDQKKIGQIFEQHIQPKIREMLKQEKARAESQPEAKDGGGVTLFLTGAKIP